MNIPQDPMMLYSYINMKLRDEYASLDELCEDLDLDRGGIEQTLLNAGFGYSEEYNKFFSL